ncbi:acetoin utilization deacetylase AcuC-like enzyme [Crenobacter luteus]|uniref:histone deacetylase family protein n=1 Tax=Crenobacter luteus TaxID=1452487 RepID=UPI00104FBCF0|nr:histone deacetylase [Crenobacter luteus]TCP09405.1 acetoin utilization deacetylase AcuC-like enzyme [Crenobacter luteus]
MRIYRTDRFTLPLPDRQRFPVCKYRMLAEAVAAFAAARMEEAPAATFAELTRVHAPDYVRGVFDGSLPSARWREIGFPWSPELAERSARSVGATVAAARSALVDGVGVNLAGGTHHAAVAHGSGFCVFNDVAVAARLMLDEGRVRRVLVIDLDVHQGNGTAAIFRDEARVFTFSMHGEKNFPFRKVAGDWDIDLPDAIGDADYLTTLDDALPALFARARPDLVFYLAGADPYQGDRLGRLGLSMHGLAERDRRVIDACRAHGVALAVAMAGGYAEPIADTVAIQTHTVRLALGLDCPILSARGGPAD